MPGATHRDVAVVTPEALAHRGELVAVDENAQFSADLLGAAGSVKRAIYWSTSGVTGQPVEVAGVFAVPKGDTPKGGWPVVSVGHGTTGLDHGCGPSQLPDLAGYQSTVTGLLSGGYVVAMTDYEGQSDTGTHAYLEPRSAAYNVIDAVRAVRHIFADVSESWAAVGGSQGGQAAWAANEVNTDYGQGLELVGTVALAPPANVAPMAELALHQQLTREQRGVFPLVVVGLQRAGLLASTDPYLRGSARPAGSDVLGCGPVPSYLRDHLRSDEVGPDSEHAAEVLQHALQLIALPQQPLSAPMAVLNGTEDQVIPAEWVEESVRASCALDGQIQHVELLQATHSSGFPYGDIEEWLGKRFTGDPPESNCGQ